jgi:hypothetical protein
MFSITVIAFFHLLFLGSVAADSGDDFSNNLFTDLGPYSFLFYLLSRENYPFFVQFC